MGELGKPLCQKIGQVEDLDFLGGGIAGSNVPQVIEFAPLRGPGTGQGLGTLVEVAFAPP